MAALPGLPGGQPLAPQKQTVYNGVQCQVQAQPDGSAALIFIAAGEVLVFPLDSSARKVIGQQLLAPGIAVANGLAVAG